jgi:hypothetical protein
MNRNIGRNIEYKLSTLNNKNQSVLHYVEYELELILDMFLKLISVEEIESIDDFSKICKKYIIGIEHTIWNMLIVSYNIKYENEHIYMYNDHENIRISSLYPLYSIFEMNVTRSFKNGTTKNIIRNTVANNNRIKSANYSRASLVTHVDPLSHETIRTQFASQQKDIEPFVAPSKNRYNGGQITHNKNWLDKKQLEKKNIQNIQNTSNTNDLLKPNESLRIFESDKKSYLLMKLDINNGILKANEINSYFYDKYQIFKILDSRNAIKFNNNDDIKNEYKLFLDMFECCDELAENVNVKATEINPPDNKADIYIPHNYKYMTNDQKNTYAKKYKMTAHDLDKYIATTKDSVEERIYGNEPHSTVQKTDESNLIVQNTEDVSKPKEVLKDDDIKFESSETDDSDESDDETTKENIKNMMLNYSNTNNHVKSNVKII